MEASTARQILPLSALGNSDAWAPPLRPAAKHSLTAVAAQLWRPSRHYSSLSRARYPGPPLARPAILLSLPRRTQSHTLWDTELSFRSHTALSPPTTACDGVASSWPTSNEAGAALADAGSALDLSPSLLAVSSLGLVLVYAAAKTAIYFKRQFEIAAILRRYVPRGGAKILDLHVDNGRHLYYLPSDVTKIVALGATVEPGLIKAQGVQAGVEVEFPGSHAKSKSPGGPQAVASALSTLQRTPTSSYDAVLSVGGAFSSALTASDPAVQAQCSALLREIARVLKPGRPFIFLERVVSGSTDSQSPVFFMSEEDGNLFAGVVWDYVMGWADKHVAGVATTETLG